MQSNYFYNDNDIEYFKNNHFQYFIDFIKLKLSNNREN